MLDTTLRDGSHSIGFGFTSEDTARICKALESAGFRYIEIGHALGLGAGDSGLRRAAATDEEYLRAGRDTLTEAGFGMFCIPGVTKLDHITMAADYGMGFIRVGPNVSNIEDSKPLIRAAERLGMLVCLNILKSYALPPKRFAEEVKRTEDVGVQVAYIMDSAGCMLPEDVVRYLEAIRDVSDIPVGFHAHDNLGMAVYSSLRMVDEGAMFVDSSLQGLGRGAGNAMTEALIAALHKRGHSTGIDLRRTLRAGYELVRPFGAKGAIMPMDVVAGYAGFHSSYLPIVLRVARRHSIDPVGLIIEVCNVDRVHCSEESVEEIAGRLTRDPGLDRYLGHYGDAEVPT